MGKDSEPLQSGKGRALNVKVAQTCLALHVSHQFTHFAATDGGKDHEDKLEEDGKYVPNPRVAYGVFEGPTRFGRRVPGDALHELSRAITRAGVPRGVAVASIARLPSSTDDPRVLGIDGRSS